MDYQIAISKAPRATTDFMGGDSDGQAKAVVDEQHQQDWLRQSLFCAGFIKMTLANTVGDQS